MATKMNENGVSTCKAGEKYEKFQMTVGRKRRTFYHYDYRDRAECRQKPDDWLIQKERKYMTEQ